MIMIIGKTYITLHYRIKEIFHFSYYLIITPQV